MAANKIDDHFGSQVGKVFLLNESCEVVFSDNLFDTVFAQRTQIHGVSLAENSENVVHANSLLQKPQTQGFQSDQTVNCCQFAHLQRLL